MRLFFLAAACILSLNASAQFWRLKSKPHKPALQQINTFSAPNLAVGIGPAQIIPVRLQFAATYNFDKIEQAMIKEAKHNMRFRIYNLASYNFSELAAWYIIQNRFSEAKWYLLQSNTLARSQNDAPHTIANLLALADIKATIGEAILAKDDLLEARALARANGLTRSVADIDTRIAVLLNAKTLAAKPALRYSEAVEAAVRKGELN